MTTPTLEEQRFEAVNYAIAQRPWNIAMDQEGTLILEWTFDHKTVTIFHAQFETTYIRSWGPSPTNDMEEGEIKTEKDVDELLAWLHKAREFYIG